MDRIEQGQLIAIAAGVVLLIAAFSWRRSILRAFRDFFQEKSHAEHLGVWRIALFGAVFVMAAKANSDPSFYNTVPESLWFPLPGWGWLDGPIPQPLAVGSQWGFIAFSFLACIGLFTRTSAAIATACAFVALGLPQFFTKINHYHHLVWFMAILAASRSGDAWSIDAWLARRRNPELPTPGYARAYGLPLRYTWLLLGIVYFFPGFWKLWTIGLNWPLGDSLRYQMYEIWSKQDFLPPIRVDKSDTLVGIAGVATVFFELALLFFFIPRKTRGWAALSGFLFHMNCGFFMNIPYLSLVACYPSFVPWERVLARLRRVPGLGVLLGGAPTGASGGEPSSSLRPLHGLAAVLVAGALFTGAFPIDSWPFSCYPRWDYWAEPVKPNIEIETVDASNESMAVDLMGYRNHFNRYRWDPLLMQIALCEDPDQQRDMCAGLWTLLRRDDPALEKAVRVRFFVTETWVHPDRLSENPITRRLAHTFTASELQEYK